MARLIIVSNRIPLQNQEGHLPVGGLTSALRCAISNQEAIWLGWSGKTMRSSPHDYSLTKIRQGALNYLLLDLTKADIENYYNGFANRVLWPLCHYRIDLIDYSQENMEGYFRVNAIFADKLNKILKKGDIIWIHDYHFLPLAAKLRQLGIKNRIGFFMHIPWPSADIFFTLPIYEKLLRAMTAYDVIGFQTENDLANFINSLKTSDIARPVSKRRKSKSKSGYYQSQDKSFYIGVFPISIDASIFYQNTALANDHPLLTSFQKSLNGKALLIGVDRLDYAKGILQRMQAYERFLAHNKASHGKVSFLQITPKSRSEVPEYRAMQNKVAELAGQINGHYGHLDWMPIRYVNQSVSQNLLKALYRSAKVALVTPLRDGMNLVAKEYIAAQNKNDPGVLILSQFAGAAKELRGALLINPYDRENFAKAIAQALAMDLKERQKRWQPMYRHVTKHSISRWTADFLKLLKQA